MQLAYGDPDFAQEQDRYQSISQSADGRVLAGEVQGVNNYAVFSYASNGSGKKLFAKRLVKPVAITQLADGRVLVAESGALNVSAFLPK